jgi:hypothetical protein
MFTDLIIDTVRGFTLSAIPLGFVGIVCWLLTGGV